MTFGKSEIDRRSFLVGGASIMVGVVGCTITGPSPSAPPAPGVPSGTSALAPSPTSASQPASPAQTSSPSTPASIGLPRVSPWAPNPGDVNPVVKLTAVRVVEAIGSWSTSGGSGVEAARRRVAALGQSGGLARESRSLLASADRAVVEVVDAQYGGILTSSASVLVVCRQWLVASNTLVRGGTTVDVRLRRTGGDWSVTAIHPAHPGPALTAPPALAARVLGSPRIELPPASVADIRSGSVHDSVLQALLSLSRDYRVGVSVIRSGHPLHVFGTGRLSDHPRGRAFDTWRINGVSVVDPATSKSLVTGYMEAAASVGSYNVGGPYQLSGPPRQFFTDATHHDHVHAGFRL